MKCPICGGKGTVQKIIYEDWQKDEIVRSAVKCPRCNGSGEVPMTNEEWLRQANKEEMEHTLTMLIMKDRFFADKEFAYVNIRFGVHCWLKEIHQ